ncbi:MAG: hypothetical protein ABI781_14100 [Burkholderiales bacterium]
MKNLPRVETLVATTFFLGVTYSSSTLAQPDAGCGTGIGARLCEYLKQDPGWPPLLVVLIAFIAFLALCALLVSVTAILLVRRERAIDRQLAQMSDAIQRLGERHEKS